MCRTRFAIGEDRGSLYGLIRHTMDHLRARERLNWIEIGSSHGIRHLDLRAIYTSHSPSLDDAKHLNFRLRNIFSACFSTGCLSSSAPPTQSSTRGTSSQTIQLNPPQNLTKQKPVRTSKIPHSMPTTTSSSFFLTHTEPSSLTPVHHHPHPATFTEQFA